MNTQGIEYRECNSCGYKWGYDACIVNQTDITKCPNCESKLTKIIL
jgi:hypothetical protein